MAFNKTDRYKDTLRDLHEWEEFLLKESGLPGPRANLELLQAVAETGTEDTFNRYAYHYDAEHAPTGSKEEFIAACGVAGMGILISRGKTEYFKKLRGFACDKRWRIREAVAIALQTVGEWNMDLLLKEMQDWSKGNLLEKRAVVAALCEPKLLKPKEKVQQVQNILDHITLDLLKENNRKDEDFKILRKTLGYGWSVAVVAYPDEGKHRMEAWFLNEDKDVRWIMKENLRKNRLMRMDKDWTMKWKQQQEDMNRQT
jgi:hypothetical protein